MKRWLAAVAALVTVAACGSARTADVAATSTVERATVATSDPAPTPATTAPAPLPSTTMAAPTTAPRASTTTPAPQPSPEPGWAEIPADGSVGEVAAWTGREMLVSTGGCCAELSNPDLRRYDPVARTWRPAARSGLSRRGEIDWAWTGNRLLEVGGYGVAPGAPPEELDTCEQPSVPCRDLTDGASYDPVTDTWQALAPMPVAITGGYTAWTGRELLVVKLDADAMVGLAYDPAANTWRRLSTDGVGPRAAAMSVWTGTELIVWGGVIGNVTNGGNGGGQAQTDGFAYDPALDRWRKIDDAPVPGRTAAAAVWTGSRMIVWGGATPDLAAMGKGASYDPVTDTWRALPLSPLRAAIDPTAVWTGREVFVAGGYNRDTDDGFIGQAATYDPVANTWRLLDAAPAATEDGLFNGLPLTARMNAAGVWTGTQVLVMGGAVKVYQAADFGGYTYTPPR